MFIIIHGRRDVRDARGRVGHQCPVCRQPREFNAVEVAWVAHIYYIRASKKHDPWTELTCTACGVRLGIKELVEPRAASAGDPQEFARQTSPWGESHEERVSDMDDRARAGLLSSAERLEWTMQPFRELQHLHETQSLRGRQQSLTTLLQLVLIVALVASIFSIWNLATLRRGTTASDWYWCVGSVALVAAVLPPLWNRMRDNKRAATRRYLLPLLAQSLQDVRPPLSIDEIQLALSSLTMSRAAGSALAASVEPQALHQEIAVRRALVEPEAA
jgi:hypothetical protein